MQEQESGREGWTVVVADVAVAAAAVAVAAAVGS